MFVGPLAGFLPLGCYGYLHVIFLSAKGPLVHYFLGTSLVISKLIAAKSTNNLYLSYSNSYV